MLPLVVVQGVGVEVKFVWPCDFNGSRAAIKSQAFAHCSVFPQFREFSVMALNHPHMCRFPPSSLAFRGGANNLNHNYQFTHLGNLESSSASFSSPLTKRPRIQPTVALFQVVYYKLAPSQDNGPTFYRFTTKAVLNYERIVFVS